MFKTVLKCSFFETEKLSNAAVAQPQQRCCYFSALVLTCFRLKKGHATFYKPETIVASLLLLMVLSFKVIFTHSTHLKC